MSRYDWEFADDGEHEQVFGIGTTVMIVDSEQGGVIAYCHVSNASDIVLGLRGCNG